MLYVLTDYDPRTGIAKGIEASFVENPQMNSVSGLEVSLLINPSKIPVSKNKPCYPILPYGTYSFIPSDKKVDGTFVRGELDYNDQRNLELNQFPFYKGYSDNGNTRNYS